MLPLPTDMAKQFLQYILQRSRAIQSATKIHIVLDRFIENSPKLKTKQKRGGTGVSHKFHIQTEIPVQKRMKEMFS